MRDWFVALVFLATLGLDSWWLSWLPRFAGKASGDQKGDALPSSTPLKAFRRNDVCEAQNPGNAGIKEPRDDCLGTAPHILLPTSGDLCGGAAGHWCPAHTVGTLIIGIRFWGPLYFSY